MDRFRNAGGQIALFVALIFQLLFLFFAMVINVGLLVHHKINLQNSLDLAAYYAAAKQSENLNVIAHVNYQIRQSWKLLAWRYRVLGTAGDFSVHPYNKEKKNFEPTGLMDGFSETNQPGTPETKFYEAPSFCITYVPFKPMPRDENTCKDISSHSGIQLFKPPETYAGFLTFTGDIRRVTEMSLHNILDRCKQFGSINMVKLGSFVLAFNMDQISRQALITAISRSMSSETTDFRDIDGESVYAGARNTFLRNLTAANRESLEKGDGQFEMMNPLGSDECNSNGVASNLPPKWLKQIKVFPGFVYLDTDCANSVGVKPKELPYMSSSEDPNRAFYPKHMAESPYRNQVEDVGGSLGFDLTNPDQEKNISLGVEKNPWCLAYVGFRAQLRPKIPFLPMGAITLKSKTFAKPFGGRIGPWHHKGWSRESPYSDSGDLVDALIPPRFFDVGKIGDLTSDENKKFRAANYSRFPGDTFGLKSRRVLAYYGRATYELEPRWKVSDWKSLPEDGDSPPNFNHWSHLPLNFGNGALKEDFDILSWNSASGSLDESKQGMRYLELSAIIPDLFDVTYYSIEPDFYNNYFTRLRDHFIPQIQFGDHKVRPDIGSHKGVDAYENYSVKDQIRDVTRLAGASNLNLNLETGGLSYLIKDWRNLLTGWSESQLLNYELDPERFGKCEQAPIGAEDDGSGIPDPPQIGNCVSGGRTGFSVKMVSGDYLRSEDLKLGGDGVSPGAIKNPPPADF